MSSTTIATWSRRNPEFDEVFRQCRWNELLLFARGDIPQFRLAEALGWSQSVLSRLEAGAHVPTLRTLARIAGETGCDLSVTMVHRDERSAIDFPGARYLQRRDGIHAIRRLRREIRKIEGRNPPIGESEQR